MLIIYPLLNSMHYFSFHFMLHSYITLCKVKLNSLPQNIIHWVGKTAWKAVIRTLLWCWIPEIGWEWQWLLTPVIVVFSDLDIVPRQEPQIMHRKTEKRGDGRRVKGKHWVRNIFGNLTSFTDMCFHSITSDIFATYWKQEFIRWNVPSLAGMHL